MVATTNQLSGYSYDANGNLLSTGYTYDPENRIQFAVAGNAQYFYDGQNKRIWQASCSSGSCLQGFVLDTEIVNMFGTDGKMLASYTPTVPWNNTQTQLTVSFTVAAERAYFGGKLVGQMSAGSMTAAVQDRLGSVGKYYPYGEDRSGQPGNDQVRFATYTRDSATGNDYADQRYYSSALGRFTTPDPYGASADGANSPGTPLSWNRYSYSWSDPINMLDPTGLVPCGSSTTVNGGVISVTVFDCIGLIFPPTGLGLPNRLGAVYTVAEWDDAHGIQPHCPIIPSLPGNSNPASQIQANIDAANNVFNTALQDALQAGSPGGSASATAYAFGQMLTFLAQQFYVGGAWDYKHQFNSSADPYDYGLATNFGNFDFGAVLAGLGFNYYFTQSAAGAAQITICVSGGACGSGIPGITFPYGDQATDAAEIKKGFDYETKLLAGCKQ